MSKLTRRDLFRRAAIGGSAAAILPSVAFAETPTQPEGPFHPTDIGTDLIRKSALQPVAKGQVIQLFGTVREEGGQAIEGAIVELWQADRNGKYAHPSDPLDLTPDPDFQFWGRAVSDENGQYGFRTIKPGSYPASLTWTRPPHLHLKISRRGYHEIITQMYFAGESLNDTDLLLGDLSASEQSQVVVSFSPTQMESKPGQKDLLGIFDIEMKEVVAAVCE